MKLNIVNKRIAAGIRQVKRPSKQLKFGLGMLALIAACLMLLVIATFTQLKYDFNLPETSPISVFHFEYIPQVPVVIFIAALLGRKWGVLTVLLYIALGLSPNYPIFGLGGGLSYIFKYNFGYIAAYIFAVYFCAKELKNEDSVIHSILGALYGVLIIHVIGIIYMTTISFMQHDSNLFIYDLIYYQSLSKILYDVFFALIAVFIAKLCKKMLWIITG